MRYNLIAFLSGAAVILLASFFAFTPLASSTAKARRPLDVVRSSIPSEDGRAVFSISITSLPDSEQQVLEATAAFINESGYVSFDQMSRSVETVPSLGIELRGGGWVAAAFPAGGSWSDVKQSDQVLWELIR